MMRGEILADCVKEFLSIYYKSEFFPWIDDFTSQPESKANVGILTNSIQKY